MSRNQLRKLPLTLFVVNTLSIFIMLELLIWKIPYGSIFLVIFALTVYYNLRAFSASRADGASEVVDRGEDRNNQKADSKTEDYQNGGLN